MFSRVNHREVDHNSRISQNPFELAHQRTIYMDPAPFQPEQSDYIEGSNGDLRIDNERLLPEDEAFQRLLSIRKASDIITKKLRTHEIVKRTLQLCQEVIPFAKGNIVLNRDGNWKAVRRETKNESESIFKALDDHGYVKWMFTKKAYHIFSAGELGIKESSMKSVGILSFPMIIDSKRIGICLIYTDVGDSNFSMADVEAIHLIVKQASLAIHYQQVKKELDRKESIISNLKKWFVRSTKMAIVGEIARGMTHEINNPLQIILGRIQIARTESESREALKLVESQSLKIASLLRSFSTISGDRNKDRSKPIELNSFIRSTLEILKEQMERKGIKVHYDFQNENKLIHGVSAYLRPLILNSVLEAKKRMPPGSELFISTSVQDNDAIRIKLRDTAPKIEGVLCPDATNYGIGSVDYGQVANALLATEIGAKIKYRNDPKSPGNQIVFSIAPSA